LKGAGSTKSYLLFQVSSRLSSGSQAESYLRPRHLPILPENQRQERKVCHRQRNLGCRRRARRSRARTDLGATLVEREEDYHSRSSTRKVNDRIHLEERRLHRQFHFLSSSSRRFGFFSDLELTFALPLPSGRRQRWNSSSPQSSPRLHEARIAHGFDGVSFGPPFLFSPRSSSRREF